MRDSDTEAHQGADDQPQSSVLCDAEIQVSLTPERKSARVQTSIKMKTIGKCIQQVSSATSDHVI